MSNSLNIKMVLNKYFLDIEFINVAKLHIKIKTRIV